MIRTSSMVEAEVEESGRNARTSGRWLVDISGLHSRDTTATLNDGGDLASHAIMTNATKIFEERT